MNSPLVIPLAIFALVVLIVAIVELAKIHEKETEARQRIRLEEMEHERKMRELNVNLEQVRQGALNR